MGGQSPPCDAQKHRGSCPGRVEAGRYTANMYRRFSFDELVEAHRVMKENRALGKRVVRL